MNRRGSPHPDFAVAQPHKSDVFADMAARPPMIAICGGGETDPQTAALAEAVGRNLAAAGAVVVCGGLRGVMEAACRGAKQAGGTTVGIVPGTRTDAANAHVDIPIASGMADGRNAVIVHTADGVVALPGRFGTLSEVALALKMGKPVVSVGSWAPDPSVRNVENAEDAVKAILQAVRT